MDPSQPVPSPVAAALPPQMAQAAPDPAQAPEKPQRPTIPDSLREFVEAWWKTTNDTPDREAAIRAANESHKTLFPAWFDKTDKFRGATPQELRTREDDRRVRTQIAYRNVLQTVAMLMPDDHELRFKPSPIVAQEQFGNVVQIAHNRLADALNVLTNHAADESGFRSETAQACVQDAAQYRLGVVKVVFDRDFMSDALRAHMESKDQQDNAARFRVLAEDFFVYKRFTKDSAEFAEMEALQQALGIESELRIWAGIRTEIVPIAAFGFDPAIRNFEHIYQSGWMYHEVLMTREQLRAKYPFTAQPDGKWEGIHPDDITDAKKTSDKRSTNAFEWPQAGGASSNAEKGPSPNGDSAAERDRFKVREVWCRKLNKVFVLVDGIPYPVKDWVPTALSSKWYPFRLLRFNRVTGQVYGYSDVELMADIQHRINRKRTDEEKMRWLALPRTIYNTQGIEQTEVAKMRDHKPGEYRGINLGPAKSIKEVMEQYQADFNPLHFDTSKDEVDMSMMAGLPAQMLGTTGQAKFSSEVSVAAQGAATNAGQRANIVRRWLEDVYRTMAELLLLNLTEEEVKKIAGPLAFWPKVVSDAEAKEKHTVIVEQAKQEIQQMVLSQAMQGMPTPDEITLGTAAANRIAEKCVETFGMAEPVSREMIFARLGCSVSVALNTQADRQQRINGIQAISSSIQMLAQAAMSAGKILDLKPFLKSVAPIFGTDMDIVSMFQDPPPAAGMPGAAGAAPGPGGPGAPSPGLPPDAAGKQAPQAGADDRKAGAGVPPVPPPPAM